MPAAAALSCPASNGTQFTVGSSIFNIHCGIDYYGNDIGRAGNATSFESCITICSTTPGCVDVNWTNRNCYLKSVAINSIVDNTAWTATLASTDATNAARVHCPSSDGTTYTTPSGDQYLISCDKNYPLGDLSHQQVNSFEDCLAACDNNGACTDFTYHHGFCYLKNSTKAPEVEVGSWSGKLTHAAIACPRSNGTIYTTEDGALFLISCQTDYYGGDLSSYYEPSFENCIKTCDTTPGCIDLSYHHTFCYMKNVQTTARVVSESWAAKKLDSYVIVSPSSCPPPVAPKGSPIGQSDSKFSNAHGGLQYQQFPGSQYILQNATSEPFAVDLSDPTKVILSDTEGDTLIIYSNGTFVAFAGNCELEIVSKWQNKPPSRNKAKRDFELEIRQASSAVCNDIQFFCNNGIGVAIAGFAGGFACASIGAEIGADIGGAIGFLGNILGPEVGIPTTLAGVVLGGRLGGFLAQRIGQSLCSAAASSLVFELCSACPPTTQCGPGTITCNGGPCQDALSDPNNCGKCGNVCPSGICKNAQCSAPVCDGSTCSSLNGCGASCFCFETADSTGFCGPSELCSPLSDCSSDSDCSEGLVCATGTCCGRNVCLQACGVGLARRALLLGRNSSELYTNGLGGVNGLLSLH